MPALVAGVLVGAFLTTRMPILIVVQVLLALDVAVLIYWFSVRGGKAARGPLGSLGEVIRAAGVLLLVTALWITLLGVLAQYGVTDAATADWDALAASGFQVDPARPAAFGVRSLVVAAAVWVVGFGLDRALGERG